MRIGLDAIAMQSPDHARRGIGRYARNLIAALLASPGDCEFFLYVHEHMPTQWMCDFPEAATRVVGVDPRRGDRSPSSRMDRLARENPDDLDALLLLSPFEPWSGYTPPAPRGRPVMAAVVYDLIPMLMPEIYLFQKHRRAWYDRCVRAVRGYDALLTISESTRADCLARMGLPADRVTTIGTASDGEFFSPDRGASDDAALRSLGIDRPFVFCVGGRDPRKNLWGLIDAFARLPEPIRERHQLVLTFALYSDDELRVRTYVEDKGLTDVLVLTDDVPDEVLRTLYRRCEVFVFPSLCEGFGLPILEAMHCGAVVIAGDNSSQPEVAGDAALLVNAGETRDIADKLGRVLADPAAFAPLRARAVERAGQFSWSRTASLALESLAKAVEAKPRPRIRRRRPRVAFFSPFPPARSGVADYSQSLVEALSSTYIIDRYCVENALPEPSWDAGGGSTSDARVFDRVAAYRGYRGVVYQMGNSYHHRFLYPYMMKYPGVTTLHDFCLAGFHLGLGQHLGRRREHFAAELAHSEPDHARDLMAAFDRLGDDNEAIVAACSAAGATLNRGIFERSRRVIVHSPWCVRRLEADRPALADRAAVIPLGSRVRMVSREQKRAIRAKFGLADDALVVAAFGFVHPDKMNAESVSAFAEVASTDPSAVLLFVGQEADGGEVRTRAEAAGISGRVRFLGRQSAEDFLDLAAVTDVGLNLRRPPTNGETSAALLDLLRHGVATIVTDVATFSDYPDAIARKVRWEAEGLAGLSRAVVGLARDPSLREAMGRAAIQHVHESHDWSRVADQYIEVIEACHAEGRARAS